MHAPATVVQSGNKVAMDTNAKEVTGDGVVVPSPAHHPTKCNVGAQTQFVNKQMESSSVHKVLTANDGQKIRSVHCS